jgi:hypothetical protein
VPDRQTTGRWSTPIPLASSITAVIAVLVAVEFFGKKLRKLK